MFNCNIFKDFYQKIQKNFRLKIVIWIIFYRNVNNHLYYIMILRNGNPLYNWWIFIYFVKFCLEIRILIILKMDNLTFYQRKSLFECWLYAFYFSVHLLTHVKRERYYKTVCDKKLVVTIQLNFLQHAFLTGDTVSSYLYFSFWINLQKKISSEKDRTCSFHYTYELDHN